MRHKKIGLGAMAVVLVVSASLAQQLSKKMTNQDVMDLVSLSLSDEVIIDKIHSTEATDFDTSVPGLKALKAAKVSDAVIRAMINPHPVAAVTPSQAVGGVPTATVNTNPNDPDASHDPGIYIHANTRNGRQLLPLEPTVYTQGKSGGVFKSAMTYGIAKMKWKAVVRGGHASTKTSDANAVFYFYFEETGAGLSHASGGVSTPNEFTLLRLEVKGDTRETVVMKLNAFGSSSGSDEKNNIPFTHTKLKPGVYKVVPNAPLKPGEYCFLSAAGMGAYAPGAAAASRVFDFGILPPE